MESEWKVSSQVIAGAKVFQVYRQRDISKTDHNGNREYKNTIYCAREEAQKAVERLNRNQEEMGWKGAK